MSMTTKMQKQHDKIKLQRAKIKQLKSELEEAKKIPEGCALVGLSPTLRQRASVYEKLFQLVEISRCDNSHGYGCERDCSLCGGNGNVHKDIEISWHILRESYITMVKAGVLNK